LSRGQLQVEVIAIFAHDLEESVEAQSDRRQAWNVTNLSTYCNFFSQVMKTRDKADGDRSFV
jgi:hypothetical protein